MKQRFNVSGNFAQAYVIAHEVAHHVQNLLGISEKVDKARRNMSEKQANALSVRLELQADCFAGVWDFHANEARHIMEQGDIEGALNAASAIGDDALQRQARSEVIPDSFTHGTSAQRVSWFKRGITQSKISACNMRQKHSRSSMAISYWCMLIVGLLPVLTVAFAKYGRKDFDNSQPRAWLDQKTGFWRRADYAHRNHFEVLPFFFAVVLTAQQNGVTQSWIDALALAFIAARLLYTAR